MTPAPDPAPSAVPYASGPPQPPAPPRRSAVGTFLAGLGTTARILTTLIQCVLLLLVLGFLVFLVAGGGKGETGLRERFYAGDQAAAAKVAVIQVEGVLFEGLTDYALKQIDAAAADDHVKAVVVRVVSPGGTITASDLLLRRLTDLRKGTTLRHPGAPKPLVISMGSVAASGGYYLAMIPSDPPTVVFAEPSTITGSIGVYASFPNVEKLARDIGVEMHTIKAGDLKASGSLFKKMDKEEEKVWQDMVDHAYLQFLAVVEAGRPQLKGKLQEDIVIKETLKIRKGPAREQEINYTRYRADGGIFTADQALKYQLVDRIGYLEDAVAEAKKLAGLDQHSKVITYDRPFNLLGSLVGVRAANPGPSLDPGKLAAAAAPRLWYLAPGHDLAGLLAALR